MLLTKRKPISYQKEVPDGIPDGPSDKIPNENPDKITSGSISDEEAIEKAKKNPQAYEILYKKYFHQIFRFIHKRVQDKDDTADIVSCVFIKSFHTIGDFKYKGIPYSSWLYRVAINECNQYFNKNKTRHLVIDDQIGDSISLELEIDPEAENLADRLPQVLTRLKPLELELIELRFYEGMSFREIGNVLNMSENHSKVKTFRVVKKLKTLLTND